jgi:Protein of unknown function (DUF3309)
MIGLIVASFLFLAFLGSIPIWKYTKQWGYIPSWSLGLTTLFLIIFTNPSRT